MQVSCFVFNVYLRPTFGNLFSVNYKDPWLDKSPLQFKPKYCCWYVDDILQMLKKKDYVKKFLKYIACHHQNIKFTFEEEHKNKIAFLDILITRVGEELQTSLL